MLPSPTIAPIIYFLTNSLALLASAAVLFFGLGVMWGWLTWARYKRRARAFQEETDLLRHEIARLKLQIAEQIVPQVLPAPVAPSEESDVELEPAAQAEPIASPVLSTPETESLPAAELPAQDDAVPKQDSLAVAVLGAAPVAFAPVAVPDEVLTEVPAEPKPESVVEPLVALAPIVPTPEEEAFAASVPTIQALVPETIAPLVVQEAPAVQAVPVVQEVPVAPMAEVIEPSPPPPVQTPVLDVAAPLVAEQAQLPLDVPPVVAASNGHPSAPASEAFAAELDEQQVRYDVELGFRYDARPDRWDDLTLLRGVAGTLQERLHECGIFTFKQMAYWSEDQAKHIDARIHAKERVQRDRWVQQARDLHYLKYGEKLP